MKKTYKKKSTLKFKSAFLLYPTQCRTSHFPISYMRYPLQTPDDKLAIEELKQLLEAFMDFKELTPKILHRLLERIEIKADGTPKIFY